MASGGPPPRHISQLASSSAKRPSRVNFTSGPPTPKHATPTKSTYQARFNSTPLTPPPRIKKHSSSSGTIRPIKPSKAPLARAPSSSALQSQASHQGNPSTFASDSPGSVAKSTGATSASPERSGPSIASPTAEGNIKPSLPAYSWRDGNFSKSKRVSLKYIREEKEADQWAAKLKGTLGVDFEWRPTFVAGRPQNPIALIQIADTRTILLIQVSAMKTFPSNVRRILEDSSVLKVGVGIEGDAKKLQADFSVELRNFVEISDLAHEIEPDRWKLPLPEKADPSKPPPRRTIGLASLVEAYHGSILVKNRKIRLSNWEAELSNAQREYAANDSHAGLSVYNILLQRKTTALNPPAIPVNEPPGEELAMVHISSPPPDLTRGPAEADGRPRKRRRMDGHDCRLSI